MKLRLKRISKEAIDPVVNADGTIEFKATDVQQELDFAKKLVLVYQFGWSVEVDEGYTVLMVQADKAINYSVYMPVGAIVADGKSELVAKFKVTTDAVPYIYEPLKDSVVKLMVVKATTVDIDIDNEINEVETGQTKEAV
jgi:hypothetical protein